MGKGLIVSGGDDGQYTVTRKPDNSCISAEIVRLQAKLPEIESDITLKEIEKVTKTAAKVAALLALNTVVAAFAKGEATEAEVAAAEIPYHRAVLELTAVVEELGGLKLEKASTETEIARLTQISLDDITESLWCADITEDLTGEVGLIELNDNPAGEDGVIIQPGYGDPSPAIYDEERDGVVVSPEAVGQATNYLFWSLWPAVNRHAPLYRIGTITEINESLDQVSVLLDAARSRRHQDLDLNIESTLTEVPVEYMTCDAEAFEVDDRVLVSFEGDPITPKVIGFEKEPKRCGIWHLNGYVEGRTSTPRFMIAVGTLKTKGGEILATPDNFRVTINSTILAKVSESSTAVEWEDDSGSDLLYVGVFDEADCDEGPMLDVEVFGPAGPYGFKLEELIAEEWTVLVDTSIASATGNTTTDPYLCLSSGYSGGNWTFTGIGVKLYDADVITWITIASPP